MWKWVYTPVYGWVLTMNPNDSSNGNNSKEAYEFKAVMLGGEISSDNIESILNPYGADGWQFVGISGLTAIMQRSLK